MEKVSIHDIDFDALEENRFQGSLSTVYKSGDQCIKIFKPIDNFNEDDLYEKLMAMDGIKIDGVLMPTALIMDEERLCGYIMPYFNNSLSINKCFSYYRYQNSKTMLEAIKKASLILRDIHSHDIVCQDITFDNILINKDQEVMICDIDGCCYNGYMSGCVSVLLKEYIKYHGDKIELNKNLDRLSMMLSMFYLMYFHEIQNVSNRKYDYLAKNIKTMENLRPYAVVLKDKHCFIPELPYLDEIIDDSDDFIIDRNKQVNLVERLYSYIRH